MRIADKLSRFIPVEWDQAAVQVDITKECNELFDVLWEAPRNLPHKKDISTSLRQAYGLLLDLDQPVVQTTSVTTEHNILS